MTVILDTAQLPASQRADAISDAIVYASEPCDVVHGSAEFAWARMTYVEFGLGASVYSHAGSGLRMIRRQRHLKMNSRQRLGLAIHDAPAGGVLLGAEERRLCRQELLLVDLTQPYEYFWARSGRADCFQLDYENLGLSVELVRKAAVRLPASPLYSMVKAHLQYLCTNAESFGHQPREATEAIGAGTSQLIAALLCSALDDDRLRQQAIAEIEGPRLIHWLREHLGSPNLTAETAAAGLGVSVDRLRLIWLQLNIPCELEEWISRERTATR